MGHDQTQSDAKQFADLFDDMLKKYIPGTWAKEVEDIAREAVAKLRKVQTSERGRSARIAKLLFDNVGLGYTDRIEAHLPQSQIQEGDTLFVFKQPGQRGVLVFTADRSELNAAMAEGIEAGWTPEGIYDVDRMTRIPASYTVSVRVGDRRPTSSFRYIKETCDRCGLPKVLYPYITTNPFAGNTHDHLKLCCQKCERPSDT